MSTSPRLLVTGASGQLGRLVIQSLLKTVPAARIVATVRTLAKATDLQALGVEVREADYDQPAVLDAAFQGIDRLLLISSSEIGRRVPQHRNAIDAAVRAGVGLIGYTSLLHGDASPLPLKAEHVATEAALRASGAPFVILRNGWYLENYNGFIAPGLEHGAVFGSAGEGRIAAAARADYADAAAAVLAAGAEHAGKIYELAGDDGFTMADWAAALSEVAGKVVAYNNLPEADYKALLINIGLPAPVADLLSSSDVGAAQGGLYDASRTLSRLIGRPTTPLKTALAAALKG
ncbi:SDR family oxidoreductase [Nitrospirillum iridis]|uniref:NAD(P)H dehydrogenase (Quinone) n=1 Tax=Nitrospirillum iridis TaxID=765888 RepID=A0A7X0B2K8_9PROT|nr:SDR family oxidoreductase [Nitrospirillum iridis]MBB6254222.1 NAD(P)H dehydrogenase (quinone) [Nitrospirillum iridis]